MSLLQYCFCFKFGFFGSRAHGTLALQPGMESVPSAMEGQVLTAGRPCTWVSIAPDLCPAPPRLPGAPERASSLHSKADPSSPAQSAGIWWTVCPKSGTGLKSQDPGHQSAEGRKRRKAGNLQPSGKNKMPSALAWGGGWEESKFQGLSSPLCPWLSVPCGQNLIDVPSPLHLANSSSSLRAR